MSTNESAAKPSEPPLAPPLRFGTDGRFELRPAEFRLLIDGNPTAIGSRALQLLIALAARPAELLTKSEILDAVWPGLVVEEGNIAVQVNALRRILGDGVIATVPGRGYRLSATLHEPAPPQAAESTSTRAPSRQQLFGRAADMERLEQLLAGHDCVTLVGMSGVGKSSMAREVMARRPDASAWVDLAALSDGSQLPNAIARALGTQLEDGDAEQQLLGALTRDESFVLIFDNAEHLIEATARWAASLRRAPHLHLLVTSQLSLGIKDEQVMRLEPLHVHDESGAPDTRDGALALLIERIAAIDSRHTLDPSALPLLATICQQLDGLPLALEMAAARIPLLGIRAVHDALKERFSLLRGRRDSPSRHRTLHDALDWSHGLLSGEEQRLFRVLGLFTGGFTIDLAVALALNQQHGRWDIIDGLATLVDRSLVNVSHDEPPRYRLLESVGAYALEKLAVDSAEYSAMQRRHAEAALALLNQPTDHSVWRADMENVRAAFLWARDNDLDMAARLSGHAGRLIAFTSWRQEVGDWIVSLETRMRSAEGSVLPLRTRAEWWLMLSYLLNIRRSRGATAIAKEAVALWRLLDDTDQWQFAAANVVRSIMEPGPDLDEACALLLEVSERLPATPKSTIRVQGALGAAAIIREDRHGLLACRELELQAARALGWIDMSYAAESNISAALIGLKRYDEAAQCGRSLLQRLDALPEQRNNANLPWVLHTLIVSLSKLRAFDDALALAYRSLDVDRRMGTNVAWNSILMLVVERNPADVAARMLGYVTRRWTKDGVEPGVDENFMADEVRAVVVPELGADGAAAREAEGAMLSEEQAIALIGSPARSAYLADAT